MTKEDVDDSRSDLQERLYNLIEEGILKKNEEHIQKLIEENGSLRSDN